MIPDLTQLSGEETKRQALLKKIDSLPPEQQEKFREMFARQAAAKPFYCTRGRTCDGNPHEGFPYQHARSDQWAPEGKPGYDWRHWISMSGRGGGKALDVDTPILTDRGWSEMGQIQDGDVVFDEAGKPTRVIKAHDWYIPEHLYRVHFSDGSVLDADGEHLWVVLDHLDRKRLNRSGASDFPADWAARPALTTEEVAARQKYGVRGDREFCIPIARPISHPSAELPIAPYALGAWLGDGSSAIAELTVADSDFAEVSELVSAAGEPLSGGRRRPDAACQTYGMGQRGNLRDPATGRMVSNGSMHSRLREMGLLRNKHIPEQYLRASITQRLELLRGLMDTDGFADGSKSTVEFCSTSRRLADGVLELARSLSERPVLTEGRATLDGRDCGPKYRVTWRPSLFVPFNMQRKASLITPRRSQALRMRHRMIVKVEEIKKTLVRCITVDSPNAMYLAGHALIPTHNTQTGSAYSLELSKRMKRIGIIAPTAADLRTTIAEGPSGLIRTCERAGKPGVYEPSKRKFTFASGTEVLLFSAEEPDRLRGSQVEFWWGDEPAHWAQVEEVWEQMNFTLRLGTEPHVLLTTTPLATKWMKAMVKDPRSRVVRVSTFANAANLAKDFIEQMKIQYEGTRMGRQELHGEILEDVEGALWSGDMFQRCEIPEEFDKIVVGVDPAGSANKRSDQTGIIVVGKVAKHSYVLEDLSGTYTPDQWARKVKYAYDKWDANAVVAERNYGGDLVKSNLRSLDPFMYVKEVRATRGKVVRAEPVVGRYEQGRVFHVAGANLAKLEEEQVSWVPSDTRSPSPNRVDALVWAETDLQGTGGAARAFSPVGRSIR